MLRRKADTEDREKADAEGRRKADAEDEEEKRKRKKERNASGVEYLLPRLAWKEQPVTTSLEVELPWKARARLRDQPGSASL